MNRDTRLSAYGTLCALFYDATTDYAPKSEVDFYASFIDPDRGRTLEAMSGSGRLQIPLMQRGYIVDGVDNSPDMLERCRERCAKLQLTPQLYEQSLEKLSLVHKYATVTIAVGSFQLITDRAVALQALKNIHAHMHESGSLLIDTFIPDVQAPAQSEKKVRIDSRTVIGQTTRYCFDEQARIANAFCNYTLIVDGKVEQEEDELIQVTWYTDDEFAQLLTEAGFSIIQIYTKAFSPVGATRIVHAQVISPKE